jgi:excisionase family DNA binding protein
MPTQRLLTVREVADELSLTPRSVYGLIKAGDIPASDVAQSTSPQGARLRIRRADLDRFLEARRTAAA